MMLALRCVLPQPLGILPNGTGGLGNFTDRALVLYQRESLPQRMLVVNA